MEIRKVSVELVRAGPRHNQLLSPLTQYLGMCGDSRAGVVQLHFEHAQFLRRLNELRYQTDAAASPQRRLEILRETGTDVARVLKQVPGLSGIFSGDSEGDDVLLHLRLVMSASELALLPFEMSKLPEEADSGGGAWLALQNQVSTCVTRRVRSVSSEGVKWASRPKVLFVAADPSNIPFAEHKRALEHAFDPWALPQPGWRDSWLTVLENATVRDVRDACERDEYTHVHLLAHGAEDDTGERLSFGLDIGGEVLSGERFATAISRGRRRPTVVTVASCDSANAGSVITQGASFAHDLHSAGIPLVVASQFPLSKEGSILIPENFYPSLLWGEDPRIALCHLRSDLHSLHGGDSHDWASVAVYEAFPKDLEDQLEELRYRQAMGALEAALRGLEEGGYFEDYACEELLDRVARAQTHLPKEGKLAPECLGLLASSRVRLAELEYQLATTGAADSDRIENCLGFLEDAFRNYRQSGRVVDGLQREYLENISQYAPHWVQTQELALAMLLGRPFDEQLWQRARYGAETELKVEAEGAQAWAHGSLAELWLIRLSEPRLSAADRRSYAQEVREHAREIRDLTGPNSQQVSSTRRHFEHYTRWSGDADFGSVAESMGISRKMWVADSGIFETANAVVGILGGRKVSKDRSKKKKATRSRLKKKSAKKAAAKTASKPSKAPPKTTKKTAAKKETLAKTPSVTGTAPVATAPSKPDPDQPRDESVILDVELVPAENGDCLWIEYGPPKAPKRILIDCGAHSAAHLLLKRLAGRPAKDKLFELFVLTHIDSDHIIGVVPLFEKLDSATKFKDLWFNGWEQFPQEFLGVRQGEAFSDLIKAKKLPWNRSFTDKDAKHPGPVYFRDGEPFPSVTLDGGMKLTVLSPGPHELKDLAKKWKEGLKELKPELFLGRKKKPAPVKDFKAFDVEKLANSKVKKDPSVANGSSIGLLAEFGGRAVLLAGDAHAEVLAESIRKLQEARGKKGQNLRLDALKLSHHGSDNATTPELLGVVDCPRYLVSSDGSRFYHPDRQAIARVIVFGGKRRELFFNYRSDFSELWGHPELTERHGHATFYPDEGKAGMKVKL